MGKDQAAEMALKTKIGKVSNEMRKLANKSDELVQEEKYLTQRIKEKEEQCRKVEANILAIEDELKNRDEQMAETVVRHPMTLWHLQGCHCYATCRLLRPIAIDRNRSKAS